MVEGSYRRGNSFLLEGRWSAVQAKDDGGLDCGTGLPDLGTTNIWGRVILSGGAVPCAAGHSAALLASTRLMSPEAKNLPCGDRQARAAAWTQPQGALQVGAAGPADEPDSERQESKKISS